MNFFEQQDIARRNTRLLVFLFLLAVAGLVLITLIFLLLFPWQTHAGSFAADGSNQPLICLFKTGCDFWATVAVHGDKLFAVASALVVVIGGVSLYKWFTLLKGGRVIAEMMGASEVAANTHDTLEKRLLNVVEEMALAANMPVPAVYVMRNEPGINAFAAGLSPKDAVIAITEGALKSFNREQLQGVIGHEFSHILNGDMRLNMQMIAVLHGIMFITETGRVFLRDSSHSSRKNNGLQMMLGFGLVIIGSVGTLFANLIKAAISRQREFLADASAVQFTRNPGGVADALKVIGGSGAGTHIMDARAGEISHLFFGEALSHLEEVFATHPPLRQRIRRLEPGWDGEYLQPRVLIENITTAHEEKPPIEFEPVLQIMAATAAALVAAEKPVTLNLKDILHEPLGAAAAFCCLLLHEEETLRQRHLADIEKTWPELHRAILDSPWKNSPREDFLPIVELSTSALRLFSAADYSRFKQLLLVLMKADGVIDIYEWALYYLLKNSVDCHFGHAIIARPQYKNLQAIESEVRTVITMLIQSTAQNDICKARAIERAYAVCGFTYVAGDKLPEVNMPAFTMAIKKLANAYPLVKSRIIKALVDAAKSDGEVEVMERTIVKAIAAAMDTPVFNMEMPTLANAG